MRDFFCLVFGNFQTCCKGLLIISTIRWYYRLQNRFGNTPLQKRKEPTLPPYINVIQNNIAQLERSNRSFSVPLTKGTSLELEANKVQNLICSITRTGNYPIDSLRIRYKWSFSSYSS